MPRSLSISTLLLLSVIPLSSHAGEKPWTEVRSPNFRVLTNGSANDGRRVAREFEQMRAVFALGFPKMRLETGAPLLIFAPRDEYAMKAMAPAFWKASGPKPAGLFQHGWEKQYAVIRLDQDVPGRNNVVYHEYVHTLLHANFRWLPTWLDEGLAEFYAYTRFEGDRMYIGAPTKSSHRLDILDSRTPLPLRTFITTRSSVSRDAADTHLFYAEAWALTHFLTFGPGMDQGEKLKVFFNLLQRGMDQQKAFEQAFGNIEEVDKGYLRYINQIAFPTGVVPYVASEGEKD